MYFNLEWFCHSFSLVRVDRYASFVSSISCFHYKKMLCSAKVSGLLLEQFFGVFLVCSL